LTGDEYEIDVKINNALPSGRVEEKIYLSCQTDNTELSVVPFVVQGTILPEFHSTPEYVDLGMCRTGETVEAQLVCKSRSHLEFQLVEQRRTGGSGFTSVEIERMDSELGSYRINVSVSPQREGSYKETLRLDFRGPNKSIILPSRFRLS